VAVDLLLVAAGIALLYFGGEALIRGASRLARALGLSPLVIGLTVVAFGTSAPEMAASVSASLRGSGGIALGNVVGSNIANLGLILAVAALVFPLKAQAKVLRRELPVMMGVSGLLIPMALDGAYGRIDGVVLLLLLAAYLWVLFRVREAPDVEAEYAAEFGTRPPSSGRSAALCVLGLALLVAGAESLVRGAVSMARAAGVSEMVIGLTLVAVGTSLPELASSIVAARRREADIVLGNVVGSNIFNVLAVLGAASLARPVEGPLDRTLPDLSVMLGAGALAWVLLATGSRIERWEGALLLALYGVYIAALFA
jgi:cation:H+ antiporter